MKHGNEYNIIKIRNCQWLHRMFELQGHHSPVIRVTAEIVQLEVVVIELVEEFRTNEKDKSL